MKDQMKTDSLLSVQVIEFREAVSAAHFTDV